jgi:endonuclease YncB( thermonuclease family)
MVGVAAFSRQRLFRLFFGLIAGVLAEGVAGAERSLESAECIPPSPGSAVAVAIAEVVDGDTFTLKDRRVLSLSGVEAPKPAFGRTDPASEALAVAGRNRLAELLSAGQVALAADGPAADRHGRMHASVFLPDGRLLQAVLIAEGIVRVRRLPGEKMCLASLLEQERQARAAKRGLWASHEYAIRRADDSSLVEQIGLYELVEGRVVSVGVGSRVAFLNFGRDWNRDLTVTVTPSVAVEMKASGMPVDALAKRLVRVRGVIEQNGGPLIKVEDAAAIEVLDDD